MKQNKIINIKFPLTFLIVIVRNINQKLRFKVKIENKSNFIKNLKKKPEQAIIYLCFV